MGSAQAFSTQGLAVLGDTSAVSLSTLGSSRIMNVLAGTGRVRSHLEFFQWLQSSDLQALIPHHTLMAVWGDFERGNLSLDVSSALPGVNTRTAIREPALLEAAQMIRDHVAGDDGDWFLLRGLQAIVEVGGQTLVDTEMTRLLARRTFSLLVHTMRCARAGYECMYVFLISARNYEFEPLAMDILLPQLDLALRRLDSLPTDADHARAELLEAVSNLSERELEVLDWVGRGKSNEEIGAILSISHNTVKNHLKRIFGKLQVTSRSQAVRAYTQVKGR